MVRILLFYFYTQIEKRKKNVWENQFWFYANYLTLTYKLAYYVFSELWLHSQNRIVCLFSEIERRHTTTPHHTTHLELTAFQYQKFQEQQNACIKYLIMDFVFNDSLWAIDAKKLLFLAICWCRRQERVHEMAFMLCFIIIEFKFWKMIKWNKDVCVCAVEWV